MNISAFLKLANRTMKFYTNRPNLRVLQKLGCTNMSTNVLSQSSKKDTFQEVLPYVLNTLSASPKFTDVPEVTIWLRKVLEYNLAGGKKARGLTTVIAYEMLEKPENITEESMRLARIMGWCVEMLQAYFLVADDMMDGSTTRRGVPCWYRLPEVGLSAINDSILIYSSIFHLLKTYFGKVPQYADIVDLFSETVLLTSAGQRLDYAMAHNNKNGYSLFTIDRYDAIVKHKTAYYTYNLPIGLGLLLANVTDKEIHKRTEDICLEMGKIFQMQDDFIDCFSDESMSGKAGTDIQEGKCSWLAVLALQRSNEAQRKLFEDCYGSKDPAKVEHIKRLYEELELPRIYQECERAHYENIVNKAKALSNTSLSPQLFIKLIDMIYHRKQ